MEPKQMPLRQAIGLTIMTLFALNFLSFCGIGLAIGGDAINGRAEGGRYYLRNHGRETEVSRTVYLYSRIHALTVIFSFPPVILAALLVRKRPEDPA